MKAIFRILLIFSLLGCEFSSTIDNEKEIIEDMRGSSTGSYSAVVGKFSFVFVMDSVRILQSFPPDSLFLPLEMPKNLTKENQALRLGVYYTDYLAYLKNGDSLKKKGIQKQIEILSKNLGFTDFMLIIKALEDRELINQPMDTLPPLQQKFNDLESTIHKKYIQEQPELFLLFSTGRLIEQEHLLLASKQTFYGLCFRFTDCLISFEQVSLLANSLLRGNHHYFHFEKFIWKIAEINKKSITVAPTPGVTHCGLLTDEEFMNLLNKYYPDISVQFQPLQNAFFPKNQPNLRDQLLQHFMTPTNPMKIGFYQILQRTENLIQ